MYKICCLAHTMVLTYIILRTHILSTMLTAHDTLLTQMYDKRNWLRQLSCLIVSSPLDISDITFTLFRSICGATGSHVLGKIVKVLTNFVKCVISLPEKPESFQHLLLDLHLIRSKQLVNSLHVIVPVALPVLVALVSCAFFVLLFLCILWHVATPNTSASLLVHHCTRIQDWFLPDLIQFGYSLHVDSGSIPTSYAFHLVLRSFQLQSGTVDWDVSTLGTWVADSSCFLFSHDHSTTSHWFQGVVNNLQKLICLDGQLLPKDNFQLNLHSDSFLWHTGYDSNVPAWGTSPHGPRINLEFF